MCCQEVPVIIVDICHLSIIYEWNLDVAFVQTCKIDDLQDFSPLSSKLAR